MTDEPGMHLQRRRDDRPPRRFRKGMYILPSLFTAANVLLGYYAILQVMHGAVQFAVARATQSAVPEAWHFDNAAKAIGFAVLFDGLDGRIARMTGTASDFGRELDSLADVITFGIAPALLAWSWGFHQIPPNIFSSPDLATMLIRLGAIASFLFLIAGASRLARFNITVNPQPSNPGRPGKKYFVGMPIPAGAGVIAAVVHFMHGDPPPWWGTLTWLVLIVLTAYLMVSTWRFYSFKDVDLRSRAPFRLVVIFGLLFAGILLFSGPVLFFIAITYMFSGVFWRLQWFFRRKRNPRPPTYEASQVS
ncbi:MAG TPA: phosphatidylcholine/phosphatidylserine synthase [Terriglobales bacterium]|nr:phosphatidylcholine/phosphatidylserine synthase [Terriglobales bacterium]